jgi:hypothetical protein
MSSSMSKPLWKRKGSRTADCDYELVYRTHVVYRTDKGVYLGCASPCTVGVLIGWVPPLYLIEEGALLPLVVYFCVLIHTG